MNHKDNSGNSGPRQVVDVEIVNDGQEKGYSSRNYRTGGNYNKSYIFGQSWNVMPVDASGCASPFVTLALFLVLLGQYGLLAAIGFFFFYICGSIIGSLHFTRQLMLGVAVNPWPWRIGNWLVCFLLTVFLAAGK